MNRGYTKPSLIRLTLIGLGAALLTMLFLPLDSRSRPLEPIEESGGMTSNEVSARMDRIIDGIEDDNTGAEAIAQPSPETDKALEAQRVVDSDPDKEWLTFPRSRRHPESWVEDAKKGRLDERTMFRHVLLNKHDAFIPKARRAQLAPQLKPFVEQIMLVSKLEWKYQKEQLRLLVRLGKIQPRSRVPTERQITLTRDHAASSLANIREQVAKGRPETPDVQAYIARREDEFQNPAKYADQLIETDPHVAVLHDEKGDFYQLDVRRLAGQKALSDGQEFLRMELLGRMINWFDQQGTMLDRDRDVLVKRLFPHK